MKNWIFRISISLNIVIFVLGLGAWFNKEVFIRHFLLTIYESRVSFFDSFPLDPDDIVMLGDSITEGGEWGEIFPALPIRNRGISGDTTTGVLARLQAIVDAKPRAIFLKIGTNDLTLGPDRDVSYQQYRSIVATIQALSAGTDIYVQSVLPRGVELQDDVEHYNAQISTIANELGVTYIDLYPAFLAPDGSIRDDLTLDEVHLTGNGYRLWQSLLEPTMSIYSQPP